MDERKERRGRQGSPLMGVLSYAGQRRGRLTLAVVLAVLSVLAGLTPYLAVAGLITGFLAGTLTTSGAALLAAGAMAGYLAKALLYAAATLVSHKAAYEIIRNIRRAIMDKMARLPMGTIQGRSSGEFKQIIIDEADKLEYPIAHVIPELTSSLLVPVIVTAGMAAVDWRMALAGLASTVLGLLAYSGMAVGRGPMMEAYMQANADMNGVTVEYVAGMEVVKAFGRAADSLDRFQRAVIRLRDVTVKWYRHCWPFMSASQAIMPSALTFVLPVGLALCIGGRLALDGLIICILLSLAVVGSIQKIMEFMENLATINAVQSKVRQLLDMEELPDVPEGDAPKGNDIEVADICFTYDKAQVLHGVSFTVPAGSTTALVGPSGSGKSTVAKLIARFWDVESGGISIGGADIREIPLEALMGKISYVSQDNFLFNRSLQENIRVGRPDATDEEIERAAELAGCSDFISRFADGCDTDAGDAGERLSGGERQRIALARAILKDAPIVILDEATAFTDPESEDKIQQSIDLLTRDKTLIVIAHRLSTVLFADNIILLEDGNISSQGTHEELLEQSPAYESMWRIHTRAAGWRVREEEGAC